MKAFICVDFDGVLHSYTSGWRGADVVPDPPVPGAIEWLGDMLIRHYDRVQIAIRSSRSHQPGGVQAMHDWLTTHFEATGMTRVSAIDLADRIDWDTDKPPALVTIDDRALTFNGDWSEFGVDRLLAFKPWNKR